MNAEEKKKYLDLLNLEKMTNIVLSQRQELLSSSFTKTWIIWIPSVSFGYENSKWCPVSCATYSFKKDDRMFEQVLEKKN